MEWRMSMAALISPRVIIDESSELYVDAFTCGEAFTSQMNTSTLTPTLTESHSH